MTTTPDRHPGPNIEVNEYQLVENSDSPSVPGALNYDGTSFRFYDSAGIFNPRYATLDVEAHRLLPQLTHWIDASTYDEILREFGKVASITTWNSISKTRKIREELVTRASGKVSQLVAIQYDELGVEKERLTEIYTRTNGKISSITRVRVP